MKQHEGGKTTAWVNAHGLKAIVFITGAAILVIEISATRILSPFYGNTIFTISSVISVILGALAIGYARGGPRADRLPNFYEFYRIIFWGGLSMLILTILTIFALPAGGDFFSLRVGPIFWSFVLFFPPAYLMGMLSPFAIKLAHEASPHIGLGTLSGNIFFWSTTGSITGSLMAGFVLIPNLGITSILFAVTTTVMFIGLLGMRWYAPAKEKRELLVRLVVILMFIAFVFSLVDNGTRDPRLSFVRDGVYERLSVMDTIFAGQPARFFLQDRSASGGMFLASEDQTFAYTKYSEIYKAVTPNLTHALVIGAGIYTMPKSLHADAPMAKIDVVDIEPELEKIAFDYFNLPRTNQIVTHVMDGRRFLRESTTTYDLIVSDVYQSLYSLPTHFTTREFFLSVYSRLAPGGIFFANVIANAEPAKESLLFSEIRTMKSVFPVVHVFAVSNPDDMGIQNFILLGMSDVAPSLPVLLASSSIPFLRSLTAHIFDYSGATLAHYPILTDNFAPIDHLVAAFLSGNYASEMKKTDEPDSSHLMGTFSGGRALNDVQIIVDLGSRAIGTPGNIQLSQLLINRLTDANIPVEMDRFIHTKKDGTTVTVTNVIGRINASAEKRVVVGTHYDSIMRAYRDSKNPNGDMPGANNSASGVALLLEAMRFIPALISSSTGVDIVFFDGEEGETALGGGDRSWSPLGSTHFVSQLNIFYPKKKPDHAILFDMVCDSDLQIYQEVTSTISARTMQKKFWDIGWALDPTSFYKKNKYEIGDDHTPFINAGIPAFLVIDFDYEPWYNTTKDTPERCSARSLTVVGKTLLYYLQSL